MIDINYFEVKEPDCKREFIMKFKSKTEDILFSVIEWIPERLLPSWLMKWMNRYIDKRMAELQREQVKINWDKTYLEQAVNELRNK